MITFNLFYTGLGNNKFLNKFIKCQINTDVLEEYWKKAQYRENRAKICQNKTMYNYQFHVIIRYIDTLKDVLYIQC